MSDTYSKYAEICTKFYELTLNADEVARFLLSKIRAEKAKNALFIGGMIDVAKNLNHLALTLVDYTDEMTALAKSKLPNAKIFKADLRALPFYSEFDLVFVIGRVFTHMLTESDLDSAILSCKESLKPGGRLLIDNYESTKIQKTTYFNGEVVCTEKNVQIKRDSKTELVSLDPFVVNWEANYSGFIEDREFSFNDSMEHRAFTREEFANKIRYHDLKVIEQGDNFDETSFYTLVEK